MPEKTTAPTATVAQLLEARQAELKINDQLLADTTGYPCAAIALLKEGRLHLPIGKVKAFADALDLDTGVVMRAVLRELDPSLLDAIEDGLAPLALSPGEAWLVNTMRKSANGREIAPISFDKDAIVALVLAR